MKCLVRAMLLSFVSVIATGNIEAQAGTVSIFDGDMNTDDYELLTPSSSPGQASFSQFPIGGNPGTFMRVNHSGSAVSVFDNTSLLTLVLNVAQPHDPASGAIESLSYSEDSLGISRSGVNTSVGRVAIRQDGFLFFSEPTFTPADSATAFGSNTLNNLVASDFQAFINGTTIPTANPDFSSSGGILEFGWLLSRTGRGRVFVDDTLGFDNFRIDLETSNIPEPCSLLLILLSTSSLSMWRRR